MDCEYPHEYKSLDNIVCSADVRASRVNLESAGYVGLHSVIRFYNEYVIALRGEAIQGKEVLTAELVYKTTAPQLRPSAVMPGLLNAQLIPEAPVIHNDLWMNLQSGMSFRDEAYYVAEVIQSTPRLEQLGLTRGRVLRFVDCAPRPQSLNLYLTGCPY